MKKILLLLVSLTVIGGTVYALFPGLFPDTATLPRIPIGDGTVGKVFTKLLGTNDLGNYVDDGTVVNSLSLSGVSASGYLKNDANCPAGEKYTGIDADGKRVCGIINVLLTDYATVQGQDCPADYYRIDDTQGTTSTGDVLKAGDIIKTPPGCTMTIVFADTSILRLDGDTTISLDLGTLPDGSTIASAILSNGSVWGRILTETGSYTIGTDIIVVGVRGTSIALSSTGNLINITNTGSGWGILKSPSLSQTYVNLVDSRFSSGASVRCKNKVTHLLESLNDLKVGDYYAIHPLGCDNLTTNTSVNLEKHMNFSTPWIRKNTRKDIEYMYRLRSISGGVLPLARRNLLRDEILASIPNVSGSGALTVSGSLEATNICEPGYRWWNEREGCQENAVVAIADFTRPIPETAGTVPMVIHGNPPLLLPTSQPPWVFTPDPGLGIMVTNSGYISYPYLSLSGAIGGFIGKTIIIETEQVSVFTKTLIHFGAGKYVKTDGTCQMPSGGCNLLDIGGVTLPRTKWKIFGMTGHPSDFKIGSTGLTNGIEVRIKKITILQ